jgi:hypothetical protein
VKTTGPSTTSAASAAFGAALLVSGCLFAQEPPAPPPKPAEEVKRLHIGGLELSGVAKVEGGFLLVDDEQVGMVMFLPGASFKAAVGHHVAKQLKLERRRKSSRPFTELPRLFAVQDLEDLASDGEDTVYVLASHAGRIVADGVERRPDREVIVRAKWRPVSDLRVRSPFDSKGKEGVYRDFLKAAKAAAPESITSKTFVNAEGLALKGKKTLFVGLRHPLSAKDEALVFKAKVDALFGDEDERKGDGDLEVLRLGLGGQAVRGLHWDRQSERLLVLAGPTADVTPGVTFTLWACGADGSELKKVHTFPFELVLRYGAPEGVARLDEGHLLVVCDREGTDLGGVLVLPWAGS